MNDIMTKLAKDKTLFITIYGIGERTNEIDFVYYNTTLEYIDIESDSVDIFQLDSYSTKENIQSDLSKVFKDEIIDYIMLEIFRQIDCYVKRNKRIEDTILIDIDINNNFAK